MTDPRQHRSEAEAEERPHAPPLKARELRQADQEEQLNAHVTYEVIRREGAEELERPTSALAWSALAAGLSMGFTLLTEAFLHAHLPEARWAPLVTKFGYPVGFLVVILGSQQLFTENTLTAVLPVLAKRGSGMLRSLLRLWSVVLAANLVGAFLFAAACNIPGLFPPDLAESLTTVARRAVLTHGWGRIFGLGIFAGWLIALMVWMLPAAKTLATVIIIIVTYIIGIGTLPHVIAGSVEAFYLALHGDSTLLHALGGYTLPALLGNTLGGTALVAGLAHAQVVAGEAKSSRGEGEEP